MTAHFTTPESWPSWQRSYDYYPESDLIWLEADTKIRELSKRQKSLDDFARSFFGIDNGSYVTVTYSLDDLMKALNAVQPYDWAQFFRTRVYRVNASVPENGITQGGYRLVYNDVEPDWMKHIDPSAGTNFAKSLGFAVTGKIPLSDAGAADGTITQVWWNSPAFKAGITPEMQIIAVDDQVFSLSGLQQAILKAENNGPAIKLLLKRDKDLTTVTIDYHGGMRYPHLERVESVPDLLDSILSPAK
jgi:predicted metalloprotease with PDZ domain